MKLLTFPLPLPSLLLLALSLPTLTIAANKKAGLFQRLSRALQGGDGVDSSTTADTINNILATDPLLSKQPQQQQQQPFKAAQPLQDTWATDDHLGFVTQAVSGDMLGVFKAMTNNYQDELKQIWGKPEVAKALLDNMPIFQGIKGMKAIHQKGMQEGSLTSEDGLAALGHFTEYLQASAKALEGVMDPERFANKIYAYQNSGDNVFKDLVARVEKGDVEATLALQQELVTREVGDLIDLNEFGLRGTEPPAVSNLRDMVKNQDPAMYKLMITDDPYIQKYMADPTLAFKEAQAMSPALKEAADVMAQGTAALAAAARQG